MHVLYTCHAHVQYMSCTCHALVTHMSCTYCTHVMHMSDTCHAHITQSLHGKIFWNLFLAMLTGLCPGCNSLLSTSCSSFRRYTYIQQNSIKPHPDHTPPSVHTHPIFLLAETAVCLGVMSLQLLEVVAQVLDRNFSLTHFDNLQECIVDEDILMLCAGIISSD